MKRNRGKMRWVALGMSILVLLLAIPISTASEQDDVVLADGENAEALLPTGEAFLEGDGDEEECTTEPEGAPVNEAGPAKGVEKVEEDIVRGAAPIKPIQGGIGPLSNDFTGTLIVMVDAFLVWDGVSSIPHNSGRVYNLPGVELTLYNADETEVVGTHTYVDNGGTEYNNRAFFENLSQNTDYVLRQTGGVEGYRMDPTVYHVHVRGYDDVNDIVVIEVDEYPSYGEVVSSVKTPLVIANPQDPLIDLTINGTQTEITVDAGETFALVATVALPADVNMALAFNYEKLMIENLLDERLELDGTPTLSFSGGGNFTGNDYALTDTPSGGETLVSANITNFSNIRYNSTNLWYSYRTYLTLTIPVKVKSDVAFKQVIVNESYVDFTNSVSVSDVVLSNKVYIYPRVEQTSVTAEKVWKNVPDGQDAPAATVQLFQDGVPYGAEITLTENDATYTWTALDRWNVSTGRDYAYSVDEVKIHPNYQKQVSSSRDGTHFIVTNTYTPTQVIATKEWVNAPEGAMPKVEFQLYRNGEAYGDAVEITEEGLTHTWSVPAYDEVGEAYVYDVDEVAPPDGYKKEITKMDALTFLIQNTYVEVMPTPTPSESTTPSPSGSNGENSNNETPIGENKPNAGDAATGDNRVLAAYLLLFTFTVLGVYLILRLRRDAD